MLARAQAVTSSPTEAAPGAAGGGHAGQLSTSVEGKYSACVIWIVVQAAAATETAALEEDTRKCRRPRDEGRTSSFSPSPASSDAFSSDSTSYRWPRDGSVESSFRPSDGQSPVSSGAFSSHAWTAAAPSPTPSKPAAAKIKSSDGGRVGEVGGL